MQNLKSYRGGNPDKGYWDWRNSLPSNLRNTDDSQYDMRAAYESGAQPQYYEDDQSYHLPTRDPKTGRILKSPTHPTYLIGLIEDAKEGYYPYIKDGKTYTDTWEGNKPPIRQYVDGGETPIKGYWNERNPRQYVAPVAYDYSGEAEYRSTLPEVEVRANKVIPKTTSQRMSEAMTDTDKKIMRGAWDLAQWTPLGDPQMVADIYTDVKDQNYGSLAATAGLLAAPSFLRKPIKAIGRQINKGIKWVNAPWRAKELFLNARGITPEDIKNIPPSRTEAIEKYLDKYHGEDILPTKEGKQRFISEYKNAQRRDAINLEGVDLTQASLDIFRKDPAYAKYVLDNRLDPLDNKTVQNFIKRQQSATRGVFTNKVDALPYDVNAMLTHTKDVRSGGDRLGSQSGVYTSNSYELAERFSKSIDSNEGTSAIAKVNLDFGVDPNLSINQQLAQARRQIYPHDIHNAANKIPTDPELLMQKGYKAKESMYTTRTGSKLDNVYERAVLGPIEPAKVLNISEIELSPDVKNIRGRWGNTGVDPMPGDEELFMPRKIGSDFGDFVREAKTFFEPQPNFPKIKAREKYREAQKESIVRAIQEEQVERLRKLQPLAAKSYKLDNAAKTAKKGIIGGTSITGVLAGPVIGKRIFSKTGDTYSSEEHENRKSIIEGNIKNGYANDRVVLLRNMAKQAEERGDIDRVYEYYLEASEAYKKQAKQEAAKNKKTKAN